MSSTSQTLENHATHSQISGPLDSGSLPSEPPDIRNLFSSYIYESPEVITLDGFQDFNGSGKAHVKEVKKVESGENQSAGKCDGLLSANTQSPDGIVKCNESDELEYSECAAMVTRSSENLSLSSEPPDIKNWFSSYMYESPTLDTTDDFTISDYIEREDGKVCSAQQKKKDVKNFVDIDQSADLPSQMKISDVLTKCTNVVKKSVCTNDKIDQNHNHGSVEKFKNTKADGKDYDVNSGTILINRTSHMDAKSLQNSVGNKGLVKDSQEKEHVANGTSDLTVKGNYLTRPADRKSIGKENEQTGLLENGFIATKKKNRHENTENVRKRERVQSKVSRKVLSETSNFDSSSNGNSVEITGKWCCPQRNKLNVGPPLKQLRLEQWVRRL